MFGLSFAEMAVVIVVAVLLFGKNLPSQMKKFGGMYRDFRKNMSDLQSQLDITKEFYDTPSSSSSSSSSRKAKRVYDDYDDRDEITAPKFEPPPAEPQANSSEAA
jgi:sec-independent protein translocase protein TatA